MVSSDDGNYDQIDPPEDCFVLYGSYQLNDFFFVLAFGILHHMYPSSLSRTYVCFKYTPDISTFQGVQDILFFIFIPPYLLYDISVVNSRRRGESSESSDDYFSSLMIRT